MLAKMPNATPENGNRNVSNFYKTFQQSPEKSSPQFKLAYIKNP